MKALKDAGLLIPGTWDEKIQANTAGTVATQMYGGWYEGTIRSTSPDLAGKWGVYLMPSASADGPRAANLGGSSLAITSASKNKEAAWAYLNYTLGTNDGQVTMLKEFGLVPSLLTRAGRSVRLAGAALLGRPEGVGRHPVDAAQGQAQPRHAVLPGRGQDHGRRRSSNISTANIRTPRPRSTMRPTRSQARPACRSRNSPWRGPGGPSARPSCRSHLGTNSCGCAHGRPTPS